MKFTLVNLVKICYYNIKKSLHRLNCTYASDRIQLVFRVILSEGKDRTVKRIITLSRQFGSGGRELGKRLSEALGIPCYDHQIIDLVAEEHGLDKEYVARTAEKAIRAVYPSTIGRHFTWTPVAEQPMKIAATQHEIIKRLSDEGDCMIVGRGADVILKDIKPLRLFVYADMDARVKRCFEHSQKNEKLSETEILRMIKKIDKERSAYRAQFTDLGWGDAAAFDLCINTTGKDIKSLIPALVSYVNAWFGEE